MPSPHISPPAGLTSHALSLLNAAAEDRLLADVDTFVDWLGAQCYNRTRVELGYVDTVPHRLLGRCDSAPVWELVALALYPDQVARNLAMDELRARYIKAHPGYLARIAEDMAAESMAGVEP